MKKIVMSLLVLCTLIFMSNASLACDCGCKKAKIGAKVECSKNCDCGCQNGEECKCNKDKVQCPKKECCKKCPCGCQNGEECKCKKECSKSKCDKPKCNKEKSLIEEIEATTTVEAAADSKKECCKKSKCCKKFKKCKKLKKCKGSKKDCKSGCPFNKIIEEAETAE